MRPSRTLLLLAFASLAEACISASGDQSDGPPCIPLGCGEVHPLCGAGLADGCGGVVDCFDCRADETCRAGSCECDEVGPCEEVGALLCGTISNACGSRECGDCPLGAICAENRCGTPCETSSDCPVAGYGCLLPHHFCALIECGERSCGTFEVDVDTGRHPFACECAPGLRCADGRTCTCEEDVPLDELCAGRCGSVTNCAQETFECPACPEGECDALTDHCRRHVRPARWGTPVRVAGQELVGGRITAVSPVFEAGELVLLLSLDSDANARLVRAHLDGGRDTVRAPDPIPIARPPAGTLYGFDQAASLSSDGAFMLLTVSNWPEYDGVVYERQPDDTFAEVGRVEVGGGVAERSVIFLFDDRTLVAAGPTPKRPSGSPSGFLKLFRRPFDATSGDAFATFAGDFAFDDPTFGPPLEPPAGDEIYGLHQGCDGVSFTFEWMDGGHAPGAYGVLTFDPLAPPGDGVPMVVTLDDGTPPRFADAFAAEVPDCSGVYFVSGGELWYAPAP